jgi:hypothetical protein
VKKELKPAMDTKETLRKFEQTMDIYLKGLDRFDMKQLLWKPAEDEWSLGQMYMHLSLATQNMQLRNARLCLSPDGHPAVAEREKTEAGAAVFAAGSLPPERVRVPPSPQYTPPQPESKEQIVRELNEAVRRMREIEPELAAAFAPAAESAPPSGVRRRTVDHPRLGGLNALEWFQLAEMHVRHHLLQKKRLEDAWRDAHVHG